MARPIKCRKVEFLPETTEFIPLGKEGNTKGIVLKVEELEAIRLKDMKKLTQQECADIMGISRQTFQNIIDKAREKVAIALINGYTIKIKGGNYAFEHCSLKCQDCNKYYDIQYARDKEHCPKCNSNKVVCKSKKRACKNICGK